MQPLPVISRASIQASQTNNRISLPIMKNSLCRTLPYTYGIVLTGRCLQTGQGDLVDEFIYEHGLAIA
jgi:hypothetical protein